MPFLFCATGIFHKTDQTETGKQFCDLVRQYARREFMQVGKLRLKIVRRDYCARKSPACKTGGCEKNLIALDRIAMFFLWEKSHWNGL